MTDLTEWAKALPAEQTRELAALRALDGEAYDAALPLAAHRLGVSADDLDALCRRLDADDKARAAEDRAILRGLFLWPAVVIGGVLLAAALAAWALR